MTDRPTSPDQSPTGTHAQAGPDKVRCVLWHAPGAAMPGDLLSTLSKRISHFTFCTKAYAALANVCRIERERRDAKRRGEAGAHAASLLVVIEPQDLPEYREILEAVRFYAPGATLRQWRGGANPRFAPIVDAGMASTIKPALQPSSPPSLRLAGEGQTPLRPVVRAKSNGVQLSEEELRMLLGDEPPALGGNRS